MKIFKVKGKYSSPKEEKYTTEVINRSLLLHCVSYSF